jgi:hypothetical protein
VASACTGSAGAVGAGVGMLGAGAGLATGAGLAGCAAGSARTAGGGGGAAGRGGSGLDKAAARLAASAAESTGRTPVGADVDGRGGAGVGRGAAGAACEAGAGVATLPGVITRLFTFSTTTCLERPWEKLWRTVPCSVGRFKDRVFGPPTVRVLSPALFGSLISHSPKGRSPITTSQATLRARRLTFRNAGKRPLAAKPFQTS